MTVPKGQRRVLLGPNGAGKSVLFSIIGGQQPPTGGRILAFGRDITRLPRRRRAALGLARTFQLNSLFPRLSVEENLFLGVQALDRGSRSLLRPASTHRRLVERTDELLREWRLDDRRGAVVEELSYGEQRQIEMVLALAGRPRLLLLDEPTSGLTKSETDEVVAFLGSLGREITVLLVEHDMDVADRLAEWITVLSLGEVVADGPPGVVRADPRVREVYLGVSAERSEGRDA
ncbi:MAG: ATP-binding cassette domain-containing protein [Streptosporangiales bacterium]|nr:ATP-binding cassette domain-containing protein [Streptosporangiales bacterium]